VGVGVGVAVGPGVPVGVGEGEGVGVGVGLGPEIVNVKAVQASGTAALGLSGAVGATASRLS